MTLRLGLVALLFALVAGMPALAQTASGQEVSRSGTVLRQAEALADWQLGHMTEFDYLATFQRQSADPVDWIQAAFWVGLTHLADRTGNTAHKEAILSHGEAAQWGFGTRPRHADADAIGGVWVWAARQTLGQEARHRLAPTLNRFDAILANPSDVSLIFDEGTGERACQLRWCWSDALFMAPPVWAAVAFATGEEAYWDHADAELKTMVEALYDPVEHLFYRDSRFIGKLGPAGRKIFWSRGNGWSYAGLARIIEVLPPGHPDRGYYVELFVQMSERLLGLQGEEGYWPVSLLDPGEPIETSGTGFFVYGMAWGVNNQILDASRYGPSVVRGWMAMERAVQPDGRLGWVQQVGYAPDRVSASDTQLYGVGAFLMAASEVSRRDNW